MSSLFLRVNNFIAELFTLNGKFTFSKSSKANLWDVMVLGLRGQL
jgi:hypothetical protein